MSESDGVVSKSYRVNVGFDFYDGPGLVMIQNQITVLDNVAYIVVTENASECNTSNPALIMKVSSDSASFFEVSGANHVSTIFASNFYHQLYIGLTQCDQKVPIIGRIFNDVI
jgi:hypothetical protein